MVEHFWRRGVRGDLRRRVIDDGGRRCSVTGLRVAASAVEREIVGFSCHDRTLRLRSLRMQDPDNPWFVLPTIRRVHLLWPGSALSGSRR